MKLTIKDPVPEQILIEEINGVKFYELPAQNEGELPGWLLVYDDGPVHERQTYLGYEDALNNFVRRVEEADYR